jgi:hypothetical protein
MLGYKDIKKEMKPEEFKAWSSKFDQTTIVYVDVDNVSFLTRDYIKCKLHAEEVYGK